MGTSIAKALRQKTTVAKKIANHNRRALQNAVTDPDIPADFNTMDEIKGFLETQEELRDLKSRIAGATTSTPVKIPQNNIIRESGLDVPLFKAILIRDDLKSYLQFLERISEMKPGVQYRNVAYGQPAETYVTERNFDLVAILEEIDETQSLIDSIDSIIQYTDNTVCI